MTATSIAPLRKKGKNGKLLTRPTEIEAKLFEISSLPPEVISARCEIQDSDSADYLPSECLLHLVRENRSRPFDSCSENLFKALMERVLRGLPQAKNRDGTQERLIECEIRDEVWDRFLEMLAKDRQEYVDGLDFYEVRFDMVLKRRRLDAQDKVWRRSNPLRSIENDDETGEIAPEVERAAGSFDPFDSHAIADSIYLLRLDEAIDALPNLEKAIIEMDRKGIPIESKEPGVVNIANALGKTPKTVRKYRDRAYATLRTALTKGE
jgi:hypothetical protein